MAHFIPATFSLYEFDDTSRQRSPDQPGRRWFSSFNGLIGSPPQDVTLGWSDRIATVLVCTAGRRPHDEKEAREWAAHLANGGPELPRPRRPASAAKTFAETDRIASADSLWSQTRDVVPGGPAASTLVWDGFALGYIQFGHGAVFIAATGLDPGQFKIRKVQDWAPYDVDATKSFPLSALRR